MCYAVCMPMGIQAADYHSGLFRLFPYDGTNLKTHVPLCFFQDVLGFFNCKMGILYVLTKILIYINDVNEEVHSRRGQLIVPINFRFTSATFVCCDHFKDKNHRKEWFQTVLLLDCIKSL